MSRKKRESEKKEKVKKHLGLKKATPVEEVPYWLEASPEPGTREAWGRGT